MLAPLLMAHIALPLLAPRERALVRYSVLTPKRELVIGAKVVTVGPTGSVFIPQVRYTGVNGKVELMLVPGEYFFFIEEPHLGYAYHHFKIKDHIEIDAPLIPFPEHPELMVYTFDEDTSMPIFNISISANLPKGKIISGTSSSGVYSIPFEWTDPAASLGVTIQQTKYNDFHKVYDQPPSPFWLVAMTKSTGPVVQKTKPNEPEKVPPPETKPAQKIEPIPTIPPKTTVKMPPVVAPKPNSGPIKLAGYIRMASKNYAVVGSTSTVIVNIRYSGGSNLNSSGKVVVTVKNPNGKVVATKTFNSLLLLDKSMEYRLDVKPDIAGKYSVSVAATGDGSAKWSGTFNFTVNAK